MQTLEFSDSPKFSKALRTFCADANATGDVSDVVTPVLADVKARGDKAVLEYTQKFDGAKLSAKAMRVDPAEMKAAVKSLSVADRKAIRESIALVKDDNTFCRDMLVGIKTASMTCTTPFDASMFLATTLALLILIPDAERLVSMLLPSKVGALPAFTASLS